MSNTSLKEGDIRAITVLDLWKKGMSPKQIAEVIREPVGYVYRLLKMMEKELVKEKGV